MKTFNKTLYKNEYNCYPAWGSSEDATKIESYVKFNILFDFKEGLRFSISVPNFGYCARNPFKCIFEALEHESIGMSKYQRLKERVRKIDSWKKL